MDVFWEIVCFLVCVGFIVETIENGLKPLCFFDVYRNLLLYFIVFLLGNFVKFTDIFLRYFIPVPHVFEEIAVAVSNCKLVSFAY